MLTELRIENFAIIDKLAIDFGPGLVIFTGETGAGKSIIMDALDMLLGGRTDAGSIRADAERATVEGLFKLVGAEKDAVLEVLKREDLQDDENYVTLAREVRREGRSTARVNGRTVNVSLLKEIGAFLVDIHGQSEHLSLLDTRFHPGLLDRFAEVDSLLGNYRQTYSQVQIVRRQINELRAAQTDSERRLEMFTFQAEEIESAGLKPGEDEQLRQERDRLANAETLAANAQEAQGLIDEGTPETPAISDQLGQAVAALSSLARVDPLQNELASRAELLLEGLSDISRDLRNYMEGIEYNPKRLDEVEERLDLIYRLIRKYGGTIESVIAFGVNARKQLDTINTAAEKIQELQGKETVQAAVSASGPKKTRCTMDSMYTAARITPAAAIPPCILA